ncbi:hypothetical protein [Chitiniphilus shinanonensis]|uniref:hypothetical protein n=1 Tax=Chitiniphilus shinanonensis TaxID=553088 RepID=UPI0030335C65
MSRRCTSPFLAYLTALLLVFAQLVTAAYACAEALPAATAPTGMAMLDRADCGEMRQVEQPLLCKAHCQKEPQSADVQLPHLPIPLFVALFFLPSHPDPTDAALAPARPEPPTLVAAAPPLRIQYQVFRN